MNFFIAIALVVLQLFGRGWSSEHKAYWEWNLGRPLEGYEEHRLAGGRALDGSGPLLWEKEVEDRPWGCIDTERSYGFKPPDRWCCTLFADGSAECSICP